MPILCNPHPAVGATFELGGHDGCGAAGRIPALRGLPKWDCG